MAKQSKRDRDRKIRRSNRELRNFGKIVWDKYDHPQLYNMIMTADVEAMAGRAKQWRELAEGIEGATKQVEDTLRQLMLNWRGSAAVASAAVGTRLTQWAGDASHTATQIAAAMADYTETVETAQHRMPSPVFAGQERAFRDHQGATLPGGPANAVLFDRLLTDYQPGFEKARANKAEAVRVMEDYESRSRDIHDPLPHFESSPMMDQTQPADPPRDAGVVPVPPGRTPATPGTPHPGGVPGPGAPGGSTAADDSTSTAGFVDPARGPGPGPGGGFGPNPSTSPVPGGADSYRSGPGGGFGPGGGVGGVPGGPASSGPLAARGPAGGTAGAAGLLGGRGAGGAAGTAGGGLYPPMGGAGAPGEEDKDHKNKYDKGLDLLDDLPPAYPPVFGV